MAVARGGWAAAGSYRDLGLLLIRVGIGLSMLVFHGYSKLAGGAERWSAIGGAMGNLGVHVAPTFWGLMAALAETLGSALLILGLFFRPAAAVLAFNMLVAAVRHVTLPPDAANAGWAGASHALEYLAVYLGLVLTGPGRYALRPGRGKG